MKVAASIFIACFLSACANSSPSARIRTSPERYQALPQEHQDMARDRNITSGMSMDAVYFAWGKPASITKETRKGRETTRWDFARLKPVSNDRDAYTSYARAFTHPSYPDQLTTSVRPSLDPIPNRTATVWFIDGTVEEWELVR